jgi:ABC-type sugar transport system substrate-binding protein
MSEPTTPSQVQPSRRNLLRGGGAAAAVGLGGVLLSACTSEKTPTAAAPAAAAAGGGAQKGKKVIFVVHDKNPFFAPVQKGFEDFGKVMGWETQFTGPPAFDVQQTVDLQTNALNAKPAGVIFTRPDDKAFDATIQRAITEKVPVVLSNVAGAGFEKFRIGFVGQSFVTAGKVAGHEIAKYAKERSGKTDGVIIAGNFAPGNSALDDRIKGIQLGVAEANAANGTTYTVETLVTSTDEAKAVAIIDARYRRSPVVGWAMSAFDHQFVSTWAKNNNLVGKFGNGGFDLTAPVLTGIADGSIDFSLGQNPYAQGWVAASMIAMQIDPKFPGCVTDTGAELVDKSNIAEIQKREASFA